MVDPQQGKVSIERVFGRAFGTLRSNVLAIFGAIILFGMVPPVIGIFLLAGLKVIGLSTRAITAAIIVGLLVTLIPYSLIAGCVTRATVAYDQGRKASFGECAETAFRRLAPIFAVSILFTLAMLAGSLLLVPAVLVGVVWAVVVPVAVEEPVGIGEAFGRAANLTRGARWTVLGLGLLSVLIIIGISIASAIISFLLVNAGHQGLIFLDMAIQVLIWMVEVALLLAIQASTYVELREGKEGFGMNRLDQIFE